uniref:Plasmid stabilization system protein ParE n=1 Tax=Candidatus Kentrum sp. DK TaxID=2126562 RepID=A0A450SFJ4_9GAMM|nr:MAG: Plasmid stabilization system protein ParE [Candidatus Kentron sp. DK]
MTKIILADEAKSDLSGIIRYISIDNPTTAKVFVRELLKQAKDTLSIFPLSCPVYNQDLDIRRFVYKKYNIYYRYDETSNTATLLHVIHSALLANTELKSQ